MQQEQGVLLQLPVPTSSFVSVKVPVSAKLPLATPARQALSAESAIWHVDAQITSLLELSESINARQLGVPCVAYPASAGHCQVVCHKVLDSKLRSTVFCSSVVHIALLRANKLGHGLMQTLVGSIYKALKAQQNQLGVKMPDVKSSVSLSPLSASELAAAFSTAIQACLVNQGWFLLEREHLLNSSTWHPATGSEQTCQSVKLSVTCFAPSTVLLHIQTGVLQFLKLVQPLAVNRPCLAMPCVGWKVCKLQQRQSCSKP